MNDLHHFDNGTSVEDYTEDWLGAEGEDGWGCQVTVKRRGRSPQVRKFTVADAKTAGLWGKKSFKAHVPIVLCADSTRK